MLQAKWACAAMLSLPMALGGCDVIYPEIAPLQLSGQSYADIDGVDCLLPSNARLCALATAVELRDKLQLISRADRTGELLLFGLGTAVGLTIAKDWGNALLENLGLTIGGLTGLNAVVDTDTQAKIYDRGLTATLCLIRGYDALAELKLDERFTRDLTTIAATTNATASEKAARVAEQFQTQASQSAELAMRQADDLQLTTSLASQELVASGLTPGELVEFNAVVALNLYLEALKSAIRSRDADLSASIVNLRLTIARELSKVGDNDKLVSAQTDTMIQSMKDVVAKNKAYEDAKKAAAMTGQKSPDEKVKEAAAKVPGSGSAGDKMKEADAKLQAVLKVAEKLDATLQNCITASDYSSIFK